MSISQNFDEIPQETAEEKQARENRLKIAEYKHKLAATDYVALKIAEGAATKEEYSEQIAQRAIWRKKINELEVDINSI